MKIDVAMLDCQVAILENALARYFATGQVPGPMGTRHPSITPFEALATGDGHIVVAAGNDTLFARLCEALGCPNLQFDTLLRHQSQAHGQRRSRSRPNWKRPWPRTRPPTG